MHRCNFYLRLEKISSAVANHIHNWCESANCFKPNESLAFRSQWRPPCCQIGALHLQNISRVGFQGSRNGTGSWLLNILMFRLKKMGGWSMSLSWDGRSHAQRLSGVRGGDGGGWSWSSPTLRCYREQCAALLASLPWCQWWRRCSEQKQKPQERVFGIYGTTDLTPNPSLCSLNSRDLAESVLQQLLPPFTLTLHLSSRAQKYHTGTSQ